MDRDELQAQLLATWRRHNEILLFLLAHIPEAGLLAIPPGTRGRMVAEQFHHLDCVRRGWLDYHLTGARPPSGRFTKGKPPSRARLEKNLRESGRSVEQFLARAIAGGARPRMFGRQAVRWMGYLIAHESHHRGQIALTLKLNGMRLPDRIALNGLWGKWISGQ